MKYDFIEIGTSDFRTLAEVPDLVGISVEPVKEYFDNLPDREGLTKINAAISDTNEGIAVMHHCRSEVIEKNEYPGWLKGCNSIHQPHPSVKHWCSELGKDYDELVAVQEIRMMTLKDLFEENDVTEIDFLKIDTEGHDAVIMKSLFGLWPRLPQIRKIQYESNVLMKLEDRLTLEKLATTAGYKIEHVTSRGNQDTILTL